MAAARRALPVPLHDHRRAAGGRGERRLVEHVGWAVVVAHNAELWHLCQVMRLLQVRLLQVRLLQMHQLHLCGRGRVYHHRVGEDWIGVKARHGTTAPRHHHMLLLPLVVESHLLRRTGRRWAAG